MKLTELFASLMLVACATPAFGQALKISAFPVASPVAATDVFPMSQGCSGAPPTATCAGSAGVPASLVKTYVLNGLTFSGIGGTLSAAQCPLPGASTIGCVESAAAVSHEWIKSISTSGVPALSQPAAADLSDGLTGSGLVVMQTSPSLITPQLGVAKVTTFAGKNAITSVTAGATAQIGSGGTVACAASHVCDSVSGELTVTTGTGSLSVGTIFTVNFADTRTNIPNCVVGHFDIPATPGTSTNPYTSTETTSTLAVAATLAASTVYTTRYVCGGN